MSTSWKSFNKKLPQHKAKPPRCYGNARGGKTGNPRPAGRAARNKPTRDWSARDRSPVRRNELLRLEPLVKYMPTENAEFDAHVIHVSRQLYGPTVDYRRGMLSDGETEVEFMCFNPHLEAILLDASGGLRFSKCNIIPSKVQGKPTVLLNAESEIVTSPVEVPEPTAPGTSTLGELEDETMEGEMFSTDVLECVKILQPHKTYNTDKVLYRYIMRDEADSEVELHSWEDDLTELVEGSRWLFRYLQVCNFRGKIHLKIVPLSSYIPAEQVSDNRVLRPGC